LWESLKNYALASGNIFLMKRQRLLHSLGSFADKLLRLLLFSVRGTMFAPTVLSCLEQRGGSVLL
jgi:hypothetical protein